MSITVLDIECTICPAPDWTVGDSLLRKGDASPYNPFNRLVSVHYKFADAPIRTVIFTGKTDEDEAAENQLQTLLDDTTVLIGFNIKFDLSWLLESGFKYDKEVWDCQLVEYVLNQPDVIQPSLDEVAAMYNIPLKLDVVKENYWKHGINTDAVPTDILTEYGEQDIKITEAIYRKQIVQLVMGDKAHLYDTAKLTNDFCVVLTNMERKGIRIDGAALDDLEVATRLRHDILRVELHDIIYAVMGDTPINLDSPEQCSMLFYSRKLIDKKQWSVLFNFTPNQNKFERMNAARKMQTKYFAHLVKTGTEVLYRTQAYSCDICNGKGRIQQYKKDGSSRKNTNLCKACNATGYLYNKTSVVAGLKIVPPKIAVTANGFSTSGDTIDYVLAKGNLNAKAAEFITKYKEYNALSSYLDSVIGGIRKGTIDGILHSSFQQATTATGRLSSTNPNVQNIPRGDTFPVKKVFISRFEGGEIIDADCSQLEFRVAAEMSGCKAAARDIEAKVDIHALTAAALGVDRQTAKASTFAPLYGASKDWGLMERYPGILEWHKRLITEAVQTKTITLPTGRTFNFPKIRRTEYGCTGQTKIKNYPVQAYATGDIVPALVIALYEKLKGFKSCLVLTVHDSVIVDVHPKEREQIIKIVGETMRDAKNIIKERYNINFKVPLDSDLKIGYNAMTGVKI